jgi:hypothetical protein
MKARQADPKDDIVNKARAAHRQLTTETLRCCLAARRMRLSRCASSTTLCLRMQHDLLRLGNGIHNYLAHDHNRVELAKLLSRDPSCLIGPP